jgi:hypothetical protein
MRSASQFARSAAIAATVISIGATPAVARPSDPPASSKPVVAQHTRQWTQPRVEGPGVRPSDTPAASATPAVPLTRATDSSGGAGWLLIALAAATSLALLTMVGTVRRVRHRADPFRARRV